MAACRLVAKFNGPGGYIYEIADATDLTSIELQFDGYIDLGTPYTHSGAAGTIRYYIDPASETGALFAADADTTYNGSRHRGNGYIDLGVFDLDAPPIGGGAARTLPRRTQHPLMKSLLAR